MTFLRGLTILFAVIGTCVSSNSVPPIPEYQTAISSFEIEVFPGKPPVELSGTIQEVFEQALKMNPAWKPEFQVEASDRESSVNIAGYWNIVDCGSGTYKWQPADRYWINQQIGYLLRISGRPYSPAGPNICTRVSCQQDSAIWWCNHGHNSTRLNSYGEIADGAQVIMNNCGPNRYLVVGQSFNTDKWSVIVRGERCLL